MKRGAVVLTLLFLVAACVAGKSSNKANLESAQKVLIQVVTTAAPSSSAKYIAICAMTYTSEDEVKTLAANEATPVSRETVETVRQIMARPPVIACIDGLGFGVPQL